MYAAPLEISHCLGCSENVASPVSANPRDVQQQQGGEELDVKEKQSRGEGSGG